MYIDEKCDPELGRKVYDHLKSKGYLSMEVDGFSDNNKGKIEKLKKLFSQAIVDLGLNPDDPQLVETPKRIAKMWVNELMGGLDWNRFPKCTMFPEGQATPGSFVVEKNAPSTAVCAHHFMPFFGLKGEKDHYDFGPAMTIAYIPKGKIIGVSKLPRLCRFLSARPSNGEELCNMIRETLCFILGTEDVAVYSEQYHTCQTLRGIEANGSMVVLSASGKFLNDDKIRSEFLAIARGS